MQPSPRPVSEPAVPWSLRDTWMGVALMLVIIAALAIGISSVPQQKDVLVPALVLIEAVYLVPIAIILGWRRASWKWLGFRNFDPASLGLGCGLLILAYSVILLHNWILTLLNVRTQGELISELLQALDSPVWLIVGAVVVAPVVEEMFFRGFLFAGFRQRYGCRSGLLLSSAIFAVAHGDPASLIPIFILGCLLGFVFHRSGSIWPGVILHFLVNAFGLCATLLALQLS